MKSTQATAQCPRCLATYPAETLVRSPRRAARFGGRGMTEKACPMPACGWIGKAADFAIVKERHDR